MRTVLVCDNEPSTRSGLKGMVNELGFDRVLECADGRSAVAVALSERPDLILLDASLPKKGGLSAARMIRRKMDTSILLLAEEFDARMIQGAKKCLISAMLTKPVRGQDLGPAIAVAFARAERVNAVRRELHRLREEVEKEEIGDETPSVPMQSGHLTAATIAVP